MLNRYHVFHVDKPEFFSPGKLVVHFPKGFTKVAIVLAECLDHVFRATNHIDKPWWENPEVQWYKPESRSTSVGDIVIDQSCDIFYCDRVGWKKLNEGRMPFQLRIRYQ